MKALESLIEKISSRTTPCNGLRLYLFGSATKAGTPPNDIDLLLVYADGLLEDAHAFAEAIRSTPATPPYDVLVASETEAADLNLVAKQEAVLIWSPDEPQHSFGP